MTILSQGAEAIIELKDNKIYKSRIAKSYRHVDLDNNLRLTRTKKEIKVIKLLNSLNINVPKLFSSDDKTTIVMEYIDGKRLRDYLIENIKYKKYLKIIGEWLATMHNEGIIHGDLTTSNMLLDKNQKLFLIDFGLSFFSNKLEDKAVDIHLLKQAIQSTHYQHVDLFYNEFLKGYNSKNKDLDVFKRLDVVEKRGKNKH